MNLPEDPSRVIIGNSIDEVVSFVNNGAGGVILMLNEESRRELMIHATGIHPSPTSGRQVVIQTVFHPEYLRSDEPEYSLLRNPVVGDYATETEAKEAARDWATHLGLMVRDHLQSQKA